MLDKIRPNQVLTSHNYLFCKKNCHALKTRNEKLVLKPQKEGKTKIYSYDFVGGHRIISLHLAAHYVNFEKVVGFFQRCQSVFLFN